MTTKTEYITLRVSPDIKEKVNYIRNTTRYGISDIVTKWVLHTDVNPVTKEFFTDYSSGDCCLPSETHDLNKKP